MSGALNKSRGLLKKSRVDRLLSISSKYRYRKKAKPMTYILGAKCKDGVVIVSDRRGTRGNMHVTTNKITKIENLGIFACSGRKSTFDKFKRKLKNELKQRKLSRNENRLDIIGNIVRKTNDEARKRYGIDGYFDILYAFFDEEGIPELHVINPKGEIEEIEMNSYHVIGWGEPYGAFITKMNLEDLNERDVFRTDTVITIGLVAIRIIEKFGLDTSVGNGEQYCILKNNSKEFIQNVSQMDGKNKKEFYKSRDKIIDSLKAYIVSGMK